jgi:hypothetical protein
MSAKIFGLRSIFRETPPPHSTLLSPCPNFLVRFLHDACEEFYVVEGGFVPENALYHEPQMGHHQNQQGFSMGW